MPEECPTPIVLLLHDGELADVRGLLEELGAALVDWRGHATRAYERGSWDVVIAGGERLSDLGFTATGATPVRIAVLDRAGRDRGEGLRGVRADYVVARPVHATALRMLLLHLLYRGPERRQAARMSVGARVHFRTGLRRHPAVLLDLSSEGCRLLAYRPPRHGRQASLYLPASLGSGATFSLRGRVVRVRPPDPDHPAPTEFSLVFSPLSAQQGVRLEHVLAARARGPAVLESDLPPPTPPELRAPDAVPGPGGRAESAAERRAHARRPYGRRVIAVGEESARVLIGTELSLGGMRVEPRSDLAAGDELRIAVHRRRGCEPLVLQARVARDDGAAGLVLRFQDVPDELGAELRQMIEVLPCVMARDARGQDTPLLVSEIVARS